MPLHRRGMSMIELVLVVMLVGLLAAVATPKFAESLRVTQLETAAHRLAAHITYIRSVAINQGRSVTLSCDNEAATYQCESVDFAERIGDPIFVSLPDEYDDSFELIANFDSQTTLAFDFEGVPQVDSVPLNEGRVTLRSGEHRFDVTIANGTGITTVTRNDNGLPEPSTSGSGPSTSGSGPSTGVSSSDVGVGDPTIRAGGMKTGVAP
ncbi:MAG: GspH/FimT family protein [Rubripirellula sp.]|nr:GspH/FimT family protein [Rubripirellula sp.]